MSNMNLEVVLIQNNKKGKEKIIAYKAQKLSILKRNYFITEKECLAII